MKPELTGNCLQGQELSAGGFQGGSVDKLAFSIGASFSDQSSEKEMFK